MIELLLNPGSLSLGAADDRDPLDSHAAPWPKHVKKG